MIVKIKGRPDLHLINGCNNPKRCEYLECYCKEVPEIYSIADKISPEHLLELLNREILNPKKIQPDILKSVGYKPKEKFTRIDALAIKKEFKKLEYPLYFFDYETYGAAIPPFDGTRPYQQIPFQYSLIKKDSPTVPVRHAEGIGAALARNKGGLAALVTYQRELEARRACNFYTFTYNRRRQTCAQPDVSLPAYHAIGCLERYRGKLVVQDRVAEFAERARQGGGRIAYVNVGGPGAGASDDKRSQKVLQLIRAYRVLGSRHSQLDPLKRSERMPVPELELAYYGLTEADYEAEFSMGSWQGRINGQAERAKLKDIVAAIKKNNTPVWYLMANDEGHGFSKKNNADYQFYSSIMFVKEFLLN